ncbi:hypothetical protein BK049_04595 [Bacillus xiamenensis]|uniref:Uncharacterized protein n=1 Tax=Bacillus xiamenensis TaxID=1178537 RepID=A0AAC9NA79_9BACI|nr:MULTISPECIES: hypothetical protein [Bacillus]AOZ88041.1 hypothetical protein BK049_04595 [Bacillus xiamenensis]EKF36874.1 hypothetical protein BA1_03630 [Bacillus xiamenensis]MBG9912207.1 hypothetical protein [Bacillus xiamenensis]MCW1836555.1 hypothetical protein [Bacillus xiamenensis]MCY9574976.1 hypothetical protein [Bacillus xiamenensis]
MSDQQHNASHEEEEEFNVYDMLPPAGTIIGGATEEEMEAAAALEVRHYAFMRLQDSYIQFDGSSYKELLKDFQELEFDSAKFWRAIARRLQVPYEWPIRIDHANGPIYIGETEDSREVGESAE